jgi:farnesyl-diphosphate farnesyltransferase
MTNVLRDVPRDLSHGRCYLPRRVLARAGLAPRDLLDPASFGRLRGEWRALLARTDGDALEGFAYTLALPPRERGLRLATALPLLLAHPTLALLARGNPLDPGSRRKVARREVWVALATAGAAVAIDSVASSGALAWALERARRLAGFGHHRAIGAILAAT